jgi:hypothetical protein
MLLRVKKTLTEAGDIDIWGEEKAQILASNQLWGDKYKSSELTCLEKGLFSTAC